MALQPYATNAAGAMHGAIVPLGRSVVTGTTTSDVTFNNIPQNYQDLMVVATVRRTDPELQANILLTPYYSGITTSPQSTTVFFSDGITAQTARYSNQDAQYAGACPASYSVPGAYAVQVAHVFSYANTLNFKPTLFRSTSEAISSVVTRFGIGLTRGLNGMTIINLSTFSGSLFFVPGTTIAVYGVRSINQ